jgi:hypothetical protein
MRHQISEQVVYLRLDRDARAIASQLVPFDIENVLAKREYHARASASAQPLVVTKRQGYPKAKSRL